MEGYEKIKCKHCDFGTRIGIIILLHFWIKHKIKPTKTDFKFAFKHDIIGTTIHNIIFIIRFIIKLITFPIWWIHENI